MSDYIDIVFDGAPAKDSGRFVEVEDSKGASINFGEWIERDDGLWALRIPAPETPEFVDMSRQMQLMIDTGVNAWAVQLVAESFASLREKSDGPLTKPLRFKFRGVRITIEEDPDTEVTLAQAKGGE